MENKKNTTIVNCESGKEKLTMFCDCVLTGYYDAVKDDTSTTFSGAALFLSHRLASLSLKVAETITSEEE